MAGTANPIVAKIKPLHLKPFFPLTINRPLIANTINPPAKASATQGHHLPGL